MYINIYIHICVSVYLLRWRQVSSPVDFCWLLRALPRRFLIHKVTHPSQHYRNDTRLPFASISDGSHACLLFNPFVTRIVPPSYASVFFFIPGVLTCTRTRYSIYCVSTCVHTIFQIHLWHVFFPRFRPLFRFCGPYCFQR